MRLTLLLALLPALHLLAACDVGGGGGGDSDVRWTPDATVPPASGPPVALDAYCAQYTTLACDTAERCDCLSDFGATRAMCRAFVAESCADDVTRPVAAGTFTFDPARAGRCLAAMATIASDCALSERDVLLFDASFCDTFLVGARRAGEVCDDSDECLDPLRCHEDRCVALPGAGAPCLSGARCADAHFCDATGTCRAQLPLGSPCAAAPSGCASDLHCDAVSGLCAADIPAGGACGQAPSWCDSGLYCDARSSVCAPYVAAGGECAHARWACAGALRCDEATSRCTPYPGAGQPCSPEGLCAGELFCGAGAVCRAPVGLGAACDDDRACASDACDGGKCVEAPSEMCSLLL